MSVASADLWRWYQDVLDFVYPPLCVGCGDYVTDRSLICRRCLDGIDRFENSFCINCWQEIRSESECTGCGEMSVPLFAFGDYSGSLRESIIQFKFKGVTSVAAYYAEAISERFGERIGRIGADLLVPIPLHSGREHRRGYNQARLFADQLGPRLEMVVDQEILYRVKRRRPQARLTEAERVRNIRGVFEVDEEALESTRVILVDDVVTSGATILEARRVLEEAGYTVAGVIAMAHGV